ncbi:MAG: NADPH-dependent ferric siderophore reductase [Hyphomicrobiales bacterium]|nr:NADPH-dependent ferric siderophore reductase [Hyphomicrobiales bacterium]
MSTNSVVPHVTQRVRHVSKRRVLTVVRASRLTPNMLRVVLEAPSLSDFSSPSPDDHIKLFIPDASSPGGVCMRDYTPRAFDNEKCLLTIDFALHDGGVATSWALRAEPGDTLEIGGPRGASVVPDDFDHYLLVGDETALPSIARRVESLRPDVPVTSVVILDGPKDIQIVSTRANWRPVWVFRSQQHGDDATLLRAALKTWDAPQGDGYVWIAAEAKAARAVREYMLEERGPPKPWLKAAGYYVAGEAGAAEKFEQ